VTLDTTVRRSPEVHRIVRCPSGWIFVAAAFIVGIAAALYLLPGPAVAATATMGVQVTLQASCTMSVTSMPFGVYTGKRLDAIATLHVTCTNTTPYYIGGDGGLHSGGDCCSWYNARMIGPGPSYLHYTIYRDAARSSPWGGTSNYDAIDATGNGLAQIYTLYGRIEAGLFVAPGTYSDTVHAWLHF
jgi:spore coat protein U-like protein